MSLLAPWWQNEVFALLPGCKACEEEDEKEKEKEKEIEKKEKIGWARGRQGDTEEGNFIKLSHPHFDKPQTRVMLRELLRGFWSIWLEFV